jgi:hypothetical protein
MRMPEFAMGYWLLAMGYRASQPSSLVARALWL